VNSGVQNPRLRDALKSWVQVVLPSVTSRPSFQGEDSSLRQLDIDLRHLDTPIHRLEETRAVLDIAVRTPEFLGHASRQPHTGARGTDRPDFFTRKVMSLFVRQYLAVTRQPDLDPNAFAMIYADLEAYLYRFDDVPIRTTIELWPVIPEVSQIVVAPDIVMRRLTEEERVRSKNLSIASGRFDSFTENPPVPSMLIEIDRQVGGFNRGMTLIEAHDIGDRMLLALRLCGDGWIWQGFVATSSPNRFGELLNRFEAHDMARGWVWKKLLGFSAFYADSIQREPPPYVLTDDVARKLPIFWPRLPELGIPPFPEELDSPLRQFASSFDRENIIDRFIDQWIALEALFSPRGGAKATSIMCQRLASFVGVNGQDRRNILRNAKDSYDARSDVVHGRELNHRDFRRHANTAEDYLRRSLVKCLESQKMPNNVELDHESARQHSSASQNL
jgi:hypothetical protein